MCIIINKSYHHDHFLQTAHARTTARSKSRNIVIGLLVKKANKMTIVVMKQIMRDAESSPPFGAPFVLTQ